METTDKLFFGRPIPKPWIMWPHNMIQDEMPKCKPGIGAGRDDCRDKKIWLGLYDDFRKRRKVSQVSENIDGKQLIGIVHRISVLFFRRLRPSGTLRRRVRLKPRTEGYL